MPWGWGHEVHGLARLSCPTSGLSTSPQFSLWCSLIWLKLGKQDNGLIVVDTDSVVALEGGLCH